jgi:hypothetical protein
MLRAIEERCAAASPGPWEAFVEGRDHTSGDTMIRIGGPKGNEPDMYVSRDLKVASEADHDFIAHARQDLPLLVAEVRRLRDLIKGR